MLKPKRFCLKSTGPRAVELDRERHRRHHRQRQEESEAAEHAIDEPLRHHVPVGDRLVDDVEEGHRADEGIGARPEAELVGVRRKPDVDRQHPELAEKLEEAVLGGQRQRHDEEIDMRRAAELDQLGDGAELGIAGDDRRRAFVLAVVEDAADAHVVVRLRLERADQVLRRLAAADDDGAPVEEALAREAADGAGERRRGQRTARRGRSDYQAVNQTRENSAPILARKATIVMKAKTKVQATKMRPNCAPPRNERIE